MIKLLKRALAWVIMLGIITGLSGVSIWWSTQLATKISTQEFLTVLVSVFSLVIFVILIRVLISWAIRNLH